MRLTSSILTLLTGAACLAGQGSQAGMQPAETMYPSGYDIQVSYQLSGTYFTLSDTLAITRKLINDESFPIAGLYFLENLPPGLAIISQSVTLNGGDIPYSFSGAVHNYLIGGYDTYYWILDEPKPLEHTIFPGDTVSLEIQAVFTETGMFDLPLHTTVFYSEQGGFFSTDAPLSIQVNYGECLCTGVTGNVDNDPDDVVDVGDLTRLVSYLYIPPFRPPACPEEANINGDPEGLIDVSDLTALIKFLYIPPNTSPAACP